MTDCLPPSVNKHVVYLFFIYKSREEHQLFEPFKCGTDDGLLRVGIFFLRGLFVSIQVKLILLHSVPYVFMTQYKYLNKCFTVWCFPKYKLFFNVLIDDY